MVERVGQLGGKVAVGAAVGVAVGAAVGVVVGAAVGIGEEAIKEEGEIWDKEALDALFNKIV